MQIFVWRVGGCLGYAGFTDRLNAERETYPPPASPDLARRTGSHGACNFAPSPMDPPRPAPTPSGELPGIPSSAEAGQELISPHGNSRAAWRSCSRTPSAMPQRGTSHKDTGRTRAFGWRADDRGRFEVLKQAPFGRLRGWSGARRRQEMAPGAANFRDGVGEAAPRGRGVLR